MDLIDLRVMYEESDDFKYLKDPHTKYIVGRGSERPTVMLLADSPSATENHEGKSVVGQPGRVLDQLLALAALSVQSDEIPNAYVTSMMKFRTGVRGPTPREITTSLSWVRREWKILHRPPVIVTLGVNPTRCLLNLNVKLSEVVGNPHPIAAGGPTIWPMLSPSYAMNTPEIRPACEEHWHALGAWLKEEGLT